MKQTKEIISIKLENEMDLILAHKRSMKLAELCGLSLSVQTSFATAVSEIARMAMGKKKTSNALLSLNIVTNTLKKEMAAMVTLTKEEMDHGQEAITYAKRLVDELETIQIKTKIGICLYQKIMLGGLLNEEKIKSFVDYFKKEPPLSAYDEIRKKNIQLIALSDKLKESESDYRKLTETLPIMMFTLSPLGKILRTNEWLAHFFGGTTEKYNGITWQTFLYSEDQKKALFLWEKAQLEKHALSMQARLKHKDSYIWHMINIVPLRDKHNNITEWAGFFVDIHAQKLVEETLKNNEVLKKVQQELLYKNEELQKSNNDLEQFAYIASHDLQEPLRKIRVFSDLLGKNLSDGEAAGRYLGKIDSSSKRMSALINDVLNYSKVSNVKELHGEVDLEQILKSVKIDFELILEERNATIEHDTFPVIDGIRLHIHQLFYNIIGNAIKFCDKDPLIRISCSEPEKDELKKNNLSPGKAYVKIVFKDNGIGFDQQYAEQIFTIFQRLNDKTTYKGTGIGLALCKKIVINHGGAIYAKSVVGEGTEISVILPK
ncbi:MAG TPA: ATP-binding protein [Cytophagaceae bacterium]|nr:ATP-binding protein [Cytophagaceae bacterium]